MFLLILASFASWRFKTSGRDTVPGPKLATKSIQPILSSFTFPILQANLSVSNESSGKFD